MLLRTFLTDLWQEDEANRLKVDQPLQRELAARIAGGDERTKEMLRGAVGDDEYDRLLDNAKTKQKKGKRAAAEDKKQRDSEAEKPLAKKLDTKSNEVEVWLNTINLGQYADKIIELGLDTLNELKDNVDDITEDNDDFKFMAKYHLKKLFKGAAPPPPRQGAREQGVGQGGGARARGLGDLRGVREAPARRA